MTDSNKSLGRQDRLSKVAYLSLVPNTALVTTPLKVGPGKKIHMDMPATYIDYIEKIKEWTGAKTFSEVIRAALKLYYIVIRVSGGKGEIYVRTEEGEERLIL